MKTKIFIFTAVCLFFVGCASGPALRTVVNSFTINGDYDSIWSAVIETFAELQIPIDNMEKDSGLITTDWIDFTGQTNEDYCDCGKLGINIEESRTGKFNAFLKKTSGNSCELTMNCMFEQIYFFGENRWKRKCVSTGNLEREMHERISAKLR